MTKKKLRDSHFGICHSDFIILSSFVLRHSSFSRVTPATLAWPAGAMGYLILGPELCLRAEFFPASRLSIESIARGEEGTRARIYPRE